ncbi:hypothetical protein B7495_04590 [Cryobacterium sp. LW097]|uniref:hypothetical protein n=1 Tax=Cryobacterium sp. LW097 TaxID=1978566 RepID=UPI000B4D49AF|nr:hypothetical protein [Cryobacterium sp. LW097]ASD21460.1 hypothetical protein B7495_04590 [Cryobacterium sp. LW097]
MATAACVGGLLLGAAGCTAAPKPAPPSPTPTITPIFASDEEALAAATEAYANYLRVRDSFWADDGSTEDEYLSLSTGTAHDGDAQSMEKWRANGWHAIGITTFDSMRLQSVDIDAGSQQIRTYLCLDVTQGDVIDSEGSSVAKPDRPLRVPLEVEFEVASSASIDLKISRSEVWSGENFC